MTFITRHYHYSSKNSLTKHRVLHFNNNIDSKTTSLPTRKKKKKLKERNHDVDKPWRLNKRNFPMNTRKRIEKEEKENRANGKNLSSTQCLHWKIKVNLLLLLLIQFPNSCLLLRPYLLEKIVCTISKEREKVK